MRTTRSVRLFFSLFGCSLLCLLAACSVQPQLATNQLQTSSLVQTVAMPATSIACPADGMARPAVMKPLALGTHQNIVYVYNEVPLNTSTAFGRLRRYDVTTGQKTELVTSGLSIQHAQVSADGQWVLFLSTPDPRGDSQHSALLQLIRMDGQGLQTLYCLLAANNATASAQWSTDQKSVLISTDTNRTTSTITLLTLATGNLQTELHRTDSLYSYTVLTWLNNTRAYVERIGRQGPPPPIVLYLLDTHSQALTQILQHSVRHSYLSIDSSYDATKLFVSYCLLVSNPFDTTISVGPATGGTQQTIYHQAQTICVHTLRSISSTTLLTVGERYDPSSSAYYNQAWKMKPDGSGRTVLFDIPKGSTTYDLNVFTQFPWSNVSRNGSLYSLQTTTNDNSKLQTLVYASLSGGTPTQFASTTTGSVDIVGWTKM